MAKSLQFWLEATGLTEAITDDSITSGQRYRRRKVWQMTDFGRVVGEFDAHFEYPATWWFLHTALARRDRSVWGWFFNDFHKRQFDRRTCVNAFRKYALESAPNPPSVAMAQRDVACLLQAYGSIRGTVPDPEDATACPLRDLGLVTAHHDSDRLERTRPVDVIPSEAFLACASYVAEGNRVSLGGLLSHRTGPARVFGLGSGQIEQLAETAVDHYRPEVQIDLLGSERSIVVPSHGPEVWLTRHFERISPAT